MSDAVYMGTVLSLKRELQNSSTRKSWNAVISSKISEDCPTKGLILLLLMIIFQWHKCASSRKNKEASCCF